MWNRSSVCVGRRAAESTQLARLALAAGSKRGLSATSRQQRKWGIESVGAQSAPLLGNGAFGQKFGPRHDRLAGVKTFSTKKELPTNGAPSFAFAFDIDGVLLHVSKPIPGATEALRYLNAHNIPFILLTNGGGKLEADRVADLSDKLDIDLTKANFVQSHTPFQELVEGPDSLKDKNILVTGANAEKCRHIAEEYGFRSVITPADILMAEPDVWPFEPLMEELYARTARPLPAPVFRPGMGLDAPSPSTALKIDAMFVFNDPRDWALDIQLLTDLLLSESGYLGTYSARNGNASLSNGGWQQHGQPPLFFSNADLLWSTGFHLPRFGQGAFQAAVAGVWDRITGGVELKRNVIGKPYGASYHYAERVLRKHRHEILTRQGHGDEPAKLSTVYMIGDNPESDIAGANSYSGQNGTSWEGVLVRTGVWTPERGGDKALEGRFKPTVVVDDVKAAVAWALERVGWNGQGVL